MESHQDFRSLQARFQASQPEPGELLRRPPKAGLSRVLKKPPQPESPRLPKKPPQPEFAVLPPKPSKPEPSGLHKPPQPEATPHPRKAPQAEVGEAARALPLGPGTMAPKPLSRSPSEPKPAVLKFQPPESSTFPRKPPHPQAGGLPRKSLSQQLGLSEAPRAPPSKLGSSEPHPWSPKPDLSTLPRKPPQPQAGSFQKSPLQSGPGQIPQMPWRPHAHPPQPGLGVPHKEPPPLGGLPRTSSEPEVSALPKQPGFKALPRKPPQPQAGLPRTPSEPQLSTLPRTLPPRKGSQPQFPGDLSRKPLLPSSASEGSLPTATSGRPRWRSEDLKGRGPPPRRPLPPASSLGPPPAKPPLPPGPMDIQNFRSLAATGVQRTHPQAPQRRQWRDTPQAPDEIYELYDDGDVEPTEDSRPGPAGLKGVVQSTPPATRGQPLDTELRKAPQPQPLPPTDPKLLKQRRKAEKAEREFRKKFKFEGEIVVHTRMMIDPNAKTRRAGGKHLGIRRGEILEVLEFTSQEELLCRDPKGKYGYIPRAALLPLETEVYDDVGFWDPLENQPFPQG